MSEQAMADVIEGVASDLAEIANWLDKSGLKIRFKNDPAGWVVWRIANTLNTKAQEERRVAHGEKP